MFIYEHSFGYLLSAGDVKPETCFIRRYINSKMLPVLLYMQFTKNSTICDAAGCTM